MIIVLCERPFEKVNSLGFTKAEQRREDKAWRAKGSLWPRLALLLSYKERWKQELLRVAGQVRKECE